MRDQEPSDEARRRAVDEIKNSLLGILPTAARAAGIDNDGLRRTGAHVAQAVQAHVMSPAGQPLRDFVAQVDLGSGGAVRRLVEMIQQSRKTRGSHVVR